VSDPQPKTQVWVIVALVVLLAASVLLSKMPIGPLKPVTGLVIAVAKAVLVGMFFMHLKYQDRRMLVFALAGLAWLALLFTFTLADYLTRVT
jgi:cytochrome c oxidase subunit IV